MYSKNVTASANLIKHKTEVPLIAYSNARLVSPFFLKSSVEDHIFFFSSLKLYRFYWKIFRYMRYCSMRHMLLDHLAVVFHLQGFCILHIVAPQTEFSTIHDFFNRDALSLDLKSCLQFNQII